ncbi:MAG: hypothetical protein GTN93_29185 [Anaerolineae bacterium]|nr:hypothetical protein [Anaerolineae bacterium]
MNQLRSPLFVLLVVLVLTVACRPVVPVGQVVQADVPRVESPDVSDAQVAQLIAGARPLPLTCITPLRQKKTAT